MKVTQHLTSVVVLLFTLVSARADRVDDYIKAEMEKRHIPGLSLAIVRNGEVIRAKGYGLANVESKVPATENTVFEIASVTKPITATGIMILVEEGKLDIDDEIRKHLPSLPMNWSKVTVRHLLTHTSGIPSYLSQPGFADLNRKAYSPDALVQLVAGLPLEFQPGEKVDYCNTNYILLGLIIEKLSGRTYGEFLSEKLFRPLGMTCTKLNDRTEIIPNRAPGYLLEKGTLRNVVHTNLNNAYSTAGLLSTVLDLAKWDVALGEGKLLKASTLKQMYTPAVLNDGTLASMSFGWGIGSTRGHPGVGHSGDMWGFSGSVIRLIDDHLSVIVLTNRSGSEAGTLAEGVLLLLVPE